DLPDNFRTTGFGFYGLGEYQFARRWYIGGGIDQSPRAIDGDLVDKGGSAFLTFWPTEFVQIRSQYRHISFAEGEKANQFLFQVNFAIGAHGAHVFEVGAINHEAQILSRCASREAFIKTGTRSASWLH